MRLIRASHAALHLAAALLVAAAFLGCARAITPSSAADGGTVAEHQPRSVSRRDGIARFDWVSYEGDDSVYRHLSAGDEYANPVIAGFHPDPSIVRVGDDYYLVTSSFAYFPGVPIFRSRDLAHWTALGHVLDRPSQLPLDGLSISRGIFAPTIRHHEGTFYMITTCVDCGGNFLVTATSATGPWSERILLPEVDGIDPSLFFGDDGRAYVVNNGPPVGTPRYDGHRALWIQEFDVRTKRMTGPRTVILDSGVEPATKPIWIEGPHIFRREGYYYLIAAEGGTESNHSEVVLRSNAVRGPYVAGPANPILTQRSLPVAKQTVSSTGHADFVQTPSGEWWTVFLGARPYGPDLYNTGRETFLLPMSWRDGWPVIDDARGPIPFIHALPDNLRTASTGDALSGNFSIRDEFDWGMLPHHYSSIRRAARTWYDVTSEPGVLMIRPQRDDLNSRGAPSFLGRPQQHTHASISTLLRYTPARAGDRAGLAAFQNETHHYCLCVALEKGRRVVRVERSGATLGAPSTVLASAPLAGAPDETVYLKIEMRGGLVDFAYSHTVSQWTVLARDVDGTLLSTKVAGGFVGTLIGPYARTGAP